MRTTHSISRQVITYSDGIQRSCSSNSVHQFSDGQLGRRVANITHETNTPKTGLHFLRIPRQLFGQCYNLTIDCRTRDARCRGFSLVVSSEVMRWFPSTAPVAIGAVVICWFVRRWVVEGFVCRPMGNWEPKNKKQEVASSKNVVGKCLAHAIPYFINIIITVHIAQFFCDPIPWQIVTETQVVIRCDHFYTQIES